MQGLLQLAKSQPLAHALLVLSLVAVAGLSLGAIRVRGIGLGSAGVLFAGILWGHFGQDVDTTILHFVKEFGLVLFVYTIGLQLGPGFFDTLRSQGWQLNGLAVASVLAGAVITSLGVWLLGLDPAAAPGLFSCATSVLKLNFMTISGVLAGSTTDPPALAFAGAMAQSEAPAVSYAAVYPLTMLLRILTAQALTLFLCR